MWETQVQWLGRDDPFKKGMATHSNILAWRIQGWGATEQLSLHFHFSQWRRKCDSFALTLLFSSVQFSHWVMSDCLWHHGLQHARLPCPSPTPRAYSNTCPSHPWCHPIISSSVIHFSSHLQSFPASESSSESVLRISLPKYWSFSFSISSSYEYSGLISFRMDWLDLLAIQGTLRNLLQHHNSKASILWHSAFFIVQLSHPHMTTGKIIALTRWTFVGKIMSLIFNMLSRLIIAFLPSASVF